MSILLLRCINDHLYKCIPSFDLDDEATATHSIPATSIDL